MMLGTPVICTNCGCEDKIRLFKGTKINQLFCLKCGAVGTLKRNTSYDKERREGEMKWMIKKWVS